MGMVGNFCLDIFGILMGHGHQEVNMMVLNGGSIMNALIGMLKLRHINK